MSLTEQELVSLHNQTQIYDIWEEVTDDKGIVHMQTSTSLPKKDLATIEAIEGHPFEIKDMGDGQFRVSASVEAIQSWINPTVNAEIEPSHVPKAPEGAPMWNEAAPPAPEYTGPPVPKNDMPPVPDVSKPKKSAKKAPKRPVMQSDLLQDIKEGAKLKGMTPEEKAKWDEEKAAADAARRDAAAEHRARTGGGLGALGDAIKKHAKEREERLAEERVSAGDKVMQANEARKEELAKKNAKEKARLAGIDDALKDHKGKLTKVTKEEQHNTAYKEARVRTDREDLDAIYEQVMRDPGAKKGDEVFYPKAAADLFDKLNDLCVAMAELKSLADGGDETAQKMYIEVEKEVALQMEVILLHAGDGISHMLDNPNFSTAKEKTSEKAKAIFQEELRKASQHQKEGFKPSKETGPSLAKVMSDAARVKKETAHVGRLVGKKGGDMMAAIRARREQFDRTEEQREANTKAVDKASDAKKIQEKRREGMDAEFIEKKAHLKQGQDYKKLSDVEQKTKSALAALNTVKRTAIRLQAIDNRIQQISNDPRNKDPRVDYFAKAMEQKGDAINLYAKRSGGRNFSSMQQGLQQVFFGLEGAAPLIPVPAIQAVVTSNTPVIEDVEDTEISAPEIETKLTEKVAPPQDKAPQEKLSDLPLQPAKPKKDKAPTVATPPVMPPQDKKVQKEVADLPSQQPVKHKSKKAPKDEARQAQPAKPKLPSKRRTMSFSQTPPSTPTQPETSTNTGLTQADTSISPAPAQQVSTGEQAHFDSKYNNLMKLYTDNAHTVKKGIKRQIYKRLGNLVRNKNRIQQVNDLQKVYDEYRDSPSEQTKDNLTKHISQLEENLSHETRRLGKSYLKEMLEEMKNDLGIPTLKTRSSLRQD